MKTDHSLSTKYLRGHARGGLFRQRKLIEIVIIGRYFEIAVGEIVPREKKKKKKRRRVRREQINGKNVSGVARNVIKCRKTKETFEDETDN